MDEALLPFLLDERFDEALKARVAARESTIPLRMDFVAERVARGRLALDI